MSEPETTDEERRAAYGWCPKCGAGNDALGYAHLPTCPAQSTGWQPIATAPRDGRKILVWCGGIELVTWCSPEPWGGEKTWAGDCAGPGYQNTYEDATHWMTLPDPPEA